MSEPRDMAYEALKTEVHEWLSHARGLKEAQRVIGSHASLVWLEGKDETTACALRGIHLELGIMYENAMKKAFDARNAWIAYSFPRNKDDEHEHCDNEDCQLCHHVRPLQKENDHGNEQR